MGKETLEIPESVEGLDDFGVAEDGDEVGLGSWCRELGQVFQLAVEEEGGIGEFLSGKAGRSAFFLGARPSDRGPRRGSRSRYLERASLTVARVYRALRVRTSARQIR